MKPFKNFYIINALSCLEQIALVISCQKFRFFTMKIITIFLLLTCTFTKCVFSQQHKIDSLEQLLKSAKEDTNHVKILNEITNIYIQVPPLDYEKGLPVAQHAKNLSEKLDDKKGLVTAYINLGTIYGYFGVYDKAFENFLNAVKISERLKDSGMILNSYQNLSFAYTLAGDYEKALQMDYKIAEIVMRSGDSNKIAYSFFRLGSTKAEICKDAIKKGDSITANLTYGEAIKYDSIALDVSEKGKDTQNIAFFSIALGHIYDKCNLCEDSKLNVETHYIKFDHFSLAEQNYFKALRIYQQLNYKEGLPDCYSGLALYYRNQGELANEARNEIAAKDYFIKSLDYFLKTLTLLKELGYKHGIAYYNKETGIAYFKLGKLKIAQEHILIAANIFNEIGFKDGAKECYEKLSEIAAKRGDYEKAYEFYRNFSSLKDSMFNESKRKKIAEMNIKYETDKKDVAIISEQTLLKNEKAKKKLTILLGGVMILSGSLLTILLFRRKQTKYAFQKRLLENKALRSQLNPHFIFNALNSIQNFIQTHPETAESYLASFSHLMREVLENSEKEVITLEAELSMLKKYMDLESLRVSNGFDYEIKLDATVDEQIIQVPPLILQPIVENAIWHGIAGRSEKGKILIKIGVSNKILQCIIENYCKGENTGKKEGSIKRKSLGLQIVRERLSLLSGKNRIKGFLNMNQTDNGMQVQLGIPI